MSGNTFLKNYRKIQKNNTKIEIELEKYVSYIKLNLEKSMKSYSARWYICIIFEDFV